MGNSKSIPRSSSQPHGSQSRTYQVGENQKPGTRQIIADGNVCLLGKVYAIAAGATGIGYVTAKLLSKRGATDCIVDINPEIIQDAEAHFNSLDVPYMIKKTHGRPDGATDIAGVIGKKRGISTVAELDDDEWDKIIAVNLTGAMYCMRAELRNIVDRGSIVNVSSIHRFKGFARHGAHDASKHYMTGLARAALEDDEREFRINSVAPGAIHTPLMQKSWDSFGKPKHATFNNPTAFQCQGTAEETANVIVFLLGPESTFVNGSVYSVDGGWV